MRQPYLYYPCSVARFHVDDPLKFFAKSLSMLSAQTGNQVFCHYGQKKIVPRLRNLSHDNQLKSIRRHCLVAQFFDCGRVLFGNRVAKREAKGTVHTNARKREESITSSPVVHPRSIQILENLSRRIAGMTESSEEEIILSSFWSLIMRGLEIEFQTSSAIAAFSVGPGCGKEKSAAL